MTLTLAMRTTNRQQTNYLRGTLSALHAQGVDLTALHLAVSEPETAWLDAQLAGLPRPALHVPETRRSANANALAMVEAALGTGDEWLLLLEDDLAFCADFVGSVTRWLDRHQRSDRNIYRFFGFTRPPTPKTEAYDWPLRKLMASQAIALRRVDAADFLEWGRKNLTTWRRTAPWGASGADPAIAFDKFLACWSLVKWPGRPCLMSHPYFCMHVGNRSSLHPRGARNDSGFAGAKWSYRPPAKETAA